MRVGMVGCGSGTDMLTGSRQMHLKEGTWDEPPKICTLRETCAGSVRALSALHQTLSWALQTQNAHHSEKQYWLIEGGHRICHANANFGKRDCKLSTQHLCKHISNYLLVRCTVKKSSTVNHSDVTFWALHVWFGATEAVTMQAVQAGQWQALGILVSAGLPG